MKKLILLAVLLCGHVFAQTTTVTPATFKLKTGGVVLTETYPDIRAATDEGIIKSQACFCQVNVLLSPDVVIKTAKPSSSKASSSKSSAASSVQIAGPITPTGATASTEYDNNLATFVIDGNTSSRWESAWKSDPQWIRLDLGKSYALGSLAIDWEDSNAENFIIEGSTNASTWVTLASFTGGAFGARTDAIDLRGSYRYIRITGTKRPDVSQWGYSIYEIRIVSAGSAASSVAASSSSSSSSAASSARPAVPTNVSIQLITPIARENGQALARNEIKGYDVRGEDGRPVLFINQTAAEPVTFEGSINMEVGEILRVATEDTTGVLSKYVPFQ